MAGLGVLTAIQIVMAVTIVQIKGAPMNDPLPEMEMTHRVVLDQKGDYVMLWTPRDNDIIFEVQVATTGYVGLGFSPSGGMKGADIILGWVDDVTGQPFLHDRYATGYAVPIIDESQDVELLGGYQNDTHTVLRFSRPWNTCDPNEDMKLTGDTVRMIWSYGSEDPQEEMLMNIHVQRGSKSLYLKASQFTLPEFGDDVETWDLLSPNVSMPDDLTTLYWCKLFKMPPINRKTHIIGYMPVIEEDNMQHVHHILLYECHLPDSGRHYEKWLDVKGAQCFGSNMPPSWVYCGTTLIAWGIGGEGNMLPEHVGFPLGEEHGGATYFMMETHYDNPNLRQGVVDSSGLRIFHTENLREYDAGILMLGHDVSPFMIIPPGENWLTIGHCSGKCTQDTLPENGIKVFAGILHSHLLGTSLIARHIRNNTELPNLMTDLHYDFNFQESRNLKDEVTILPGDSLITECVYDSTKRRGAAFGGFGTQDEMCLSFFYYYPRIKLYTCTSSPTHENLLYALGVEDIYEGKDGKGDWNKIDEEQETQLANAIKNGDIGDQLQNVNMAQWFYHIIIKQPLIYQNQSFYDIVMSEETWKDKELIKQLQDIVVNGDHSETCSIKNDPLIEDTPREPIKISYPEFTPLPPLVETCISGNQDTSLNTSESNEGTPLVCPPQLPSCDVNSLPNNVLGNRPNFF